MAFSIVRVTRLTVSSMQVLFNDDVSTDVGISNITITSSLDNVPNPDIISVSVENELVTINYRPIFPDVKYQVSFKSTSSVTFSTVNGERIVEDGNRNTVFITSPGEDDSAIRDAMLDDLPDEVYESDEPTVLKDLVSAMAKEIQKTSDEAETVKSANYLSVLVEDERMVRSDGPIDKFQNGGVFEVSRVGSTPTDTSQTASIEFSSTRYQSFKVRTSVIVNPIVSTLPTDPISLQSIDVVNEKVSSNSSLDNYFDGMKIKVSNGPVIQVISVSLQRGTEYIEYDVTNFGYTLKSNRYDTRRSGINVNLANNEIELSSSSLTGLEGGFVQPKAGDFIYVSYVYKRVGRNIDADTVSLSTDTEVVRETAPAIINHFSTDNAPIVTSAGSVAVKNGIDFLVTQSSDSLQAFSSTHPAFARELKYDITRLPSKIGEYTVNYNTGDIFVFGEDGGNNGTGENPPVMNYTYRKIFVKDLDYTFNSSRDELAINSSRNIGAIEATISFDFEDIFAEGTDYKLSSHVEVLNERVQNRLIGNFKVQTKYFPVTNVFRILNETTGELYTPIRFNDTSITFSGRNAPKQLDVTRERAKFTRVQQEVLYIADELTNSYGLRILKIELENNGITDSQNRFIGANFDTSMLFSNEEIFVNEYFYEDRLFDSVASNLDRLIVPGDYIVDYQNGIIYVGVSGSQGSDLGDVTYQHRFIDTKKSHILYVNNIYRSNLASQPNLKNYTISTITDTSVSISDLEQVGERFINNNTSRVIIVGTYQSGEDGLTTKNSNIFTAHSANFTSDYIGRTLRVGSPSSPPVQDVEITSVISSNQVTVSPNFTNTKKGRVWVVIDTSNNASKTITLENNIVSVKNIYSVSQLGRVPASELDGYFDVDRDSFSSNIITLGESNPLSPGDAVIVNYNYGNIYADYRYLRDELIISYEYGQNSLDWSISGALNEDDEYYVTYKYGALRDSLLLNFGSLTQISELTNFSPNLNRELYRNILSGALQSFSEGPTIPSLERLVRAFTDVTPNITESAFGFWVLGRDNLHLRDIVYKNTPTYDLGKYGNGLLISGDQTVQVPALSHIKLNEGTIETWIRPRWKGLANDSTITFDLEIDGYSDPSSVFIGFDGANPTSIPFSLNVDDTDILVLSTPTNIDQDVGYFIWYDDTNSRWNIRWRGYRDQVHEFNGTISTTGEFFNVSQPTGSDGYSINESTDVITSTITEIGFEAFIDGYDAEVNESTYAMDGISFASGDQHYIFDMAYDESSNRMSLYKDGTGYLNFQVFDNNKDFGYPAGFYNISTNIQDWQENALYHVAVSWKFNSVEEKDEMHLFVNGYEVYNLFKYGGNPKASSVFDFGDVAQETVISSSPKNIIGGFEGSTTSGSYLFSAQDAEFNGKISVGDSLHLLDDTADGTGNPNFGASYTVVGVGTNTLQVDRAFTLTLGNLHYSVNRVTATVKTPINYQDFAIISIDENGNETELNGVDSDYPDYSVRRANDYTHVISINNGVSLAGSALIKTLGLIFKRFKEKVYVYAGDYDELRVNAAAPVTLNDVKITAIILDRTLIQTGGGFGLVGTVIGAQLVTLLQSRFDDVCQPSNDSAGRKLSVNLSGDNINYDIPGNQVIISGKTYSGAISETISFSENDTVVTSEYWTEIDSITVSVIPIDAALPAGTVQVRENKPITESENNGDFAEVVEFSNGIIKLETYGTAGQPYIFNSCTYEVDYPSFLRIRLDKQPDTFYVGSDYNGSKTLDAVIDEFRILDYISEDTRVGESLATGTRSITTDYNTGTAFEKNNNTLLLMHYDNSSNDVSDFIDRFASGYQIAPSVNSDFGNGIKFDQNKPYIIDNAGAIFENDEGTIEFWVSPMDDTRGDPNYHYYIDMTSVVQETVESSTSVTVTASQKIRSIESVRLSTDVYNTGTNYFSGGSLSNVDSKTITLGIHLPSQNTKVKIIYVPLNNMGDRVSIFRDPSGFVNFYVKASGVEHMITHHVTWKRHTWHRIMAMWKTNSITNTDRLRLFVDGNERGTIKYGTGLIYGTGVVYGQAEVRPGVNRFLVDNIDLQDTFARIYVGSDVFGVNSARAVMDNLRFSDEQRLLAIRQTSNDTLDTNYQSNTSFAIPVVEDITTTALYNFDTNLANVEYLTTLINAARGIFIFNVDVIDSFDKVIGNSYLTELLSKLIDVLKPAHTESIITYKE